MLAGGSVPLLLVFWVLSCGFLGYVFMLLSVVMVAARFVLIFLIFLGATMWLFGICFHAAKCTNGGC